MKFSKKKILLMIRTLRLNEGYNEMNFKMIEQK